jgi:hypothetical protein
MTAFVQGQHTYFTPKVGKDCLEPRDGLGRAQSWTWPDSVVNVPPEQVRDLPFDVVILQRPRDLELAQEWLGDRYVNVPKIYVEHGTPLDLRNPRHPLADRDDLTIAHVTHFNRLMWETGTTRTVVIEHGVVDPGHLFSGSHQSAAVVINEPVRRRWIAGTDLVETMRQSVPVELFGMASESLSGRDLNQRELHAAMAECRAYFHPFRWTSLGLSLIEAMHIGLPVVVLAATEAAQVIPSNVGMVSNRVDELVSAAGTFTADRDLAADMGLQGRKFALERYGLGRFLYDWDKLLEDVAR